MGDSENFRFYNPQPAPQATPPPVVPLWGGIPGMPANAAPPPGGVPSFGNVGVPANVAPPSSFRVAPPSFQAPRFNVGAPQLFENSFASDPFGTLMNLNIFSDQKSFFGRDGASAFGDRFDPRSPSGFYRTGTEPLTVGVVKDMGDLFAGGFLDGAVKDQTDLKKAIDLRLTTQREQRGAGEAVPFDHTRREMENQIKGLEPEISGARRFPQELERAVFAEVAPALSLRSAEEGGGFQVDEQKAVAGVLQTLGFSDPASAPPEAVIEAKGYVDQLDMALSNATFGARNSGLQALRTNFAPETMAQKVQVGALERIVNDSGSALNPTKAASSRVTLEESLRGLAPEDVDALKATVKYREDLGERAVPLVRNAAERAQAMLRKHEVALENPDASYTQVERWTDPRGYAAGNVPPGVKPEHARAFVDAFATDTRTLSLVSRMESLLSAPDSARNQAALERVEKQYDQHLAAFRPAAMAKSGFFYDEDVFGARTYNWQNIAGASAIALAIYSPIAQARQQDAMLDRGSRERDKDREFQKEMLLLRHSLRGGGGGGSSGGSVQRAPTLKLGV